MADGQGAGDPRPSQQSAQQPSVVSLGEALQALQPKVDDKSVDFSSSAREQWPLFRKAAVKAFKQVQDADNMQMFWSFLAWIAPQQTSKTVQRQILDLAAEAASTEAWARTFWTARGTKLPIWTVGPGRDIAMELEAAAKIAGMLLRWSPGPDFAHAWLNAAPEEFRSKVLGNDEPNQEREAQKPQSPEAIAAAAGGPQMLGKAIAVPAADVLDFASLVDPASQTAPVNVSPRPNLKKAQPKKSALAQSNSKKEEVIALQQELADVKAERDSLRGQLEALRSDKDASGLPNGPSLPCTSFVECACDFPVRGAEALKDPDGEELMAVAEGEVVEVIGRNPAGWVQVKRSPTSRVRTQDASSEQAMRPTGWLPEGLFKAIGEIGRGIALRTTAAEHEGSEELAVSAGALLKIIAKDEAFWLVEVDGCRGFVPKDAIRTPYHYEMSGLQVIEPRLERGMSSRGDLGERKRSRGLSLTGGKNGFERLEEGVVAGIPPPAPVSPGQGAPLKGPPSQKQKQGYTFSLWAYLAAWYAISINILLGIAGVFWALRDEKDYPEGRLQEYVISDPQTLAVSAYCIAFGVGWFLFKVISSYHEKDGATLPGTPIRALVLFFGSLPLFASFPTALAGIVSFITSILALIAAQRGEQGVLPKESRFYKGPSAILKMGLKEEGGKTVQCWQNPAKWWKHQQELGEASKWGMIATWVLVNIGVMAYKYYVTVEGLKDTDPLVKKCWVGLELSADKEKTIITEDGREVKTVGCDRLLDAYAFWIPVAKVFGQGLNLNCALILLCICQYFLQKINKKAIEGKGLLGQICKFVPTHKNLIFHKGLAFVILVYMLIHTFAHYMAHSYTLVTFSRFGQTGVHITLSIWATGAIIIVCIVLMYPVSREYVKRTWFEAFFYTHIIGATTFMVCCLWHGPVFYMWAGGPIALYLFDRYLRWEVTELAPARLLSVRWRPPVLQLVFDAPWTYRAGQYVWLCCPKLNWFEKHPFTIASAPESELLTLAIKCWPGGWTERLRDFLSAICEVEGKRDGFTHRFETVDWITGEVKRGITACEDGTPLLQIDGPHAAPAMRYIEFDVVILAAAGIGLTPAAAILRSLLQYRWRSCSTASPHSIYFAWLCACKEVPAFEWFAEELSDSEVAASAHEVSTSPDSGVASKRHCEVHLFVTRAPAKDAPGAQQPPKPAEARLHGIREADIKGKQIMRPYRSPELMKWMGHPATGSNEMRDVLSLDPHNRPNQAGHTLAWNGRPDWDAMFTHIQQRHSGGGKRTVVGVFFCGAPAIAKDLKTACREHTTAEVGFRLLKESF